ncbi:hypothetical protein J5N97_021828 [Dioscorea zingiberensis]|uniref:Protein kinase domain-containing protein n=1 Tax=Dioscorea zingiberensis TaxID=325984 RepID=A0A9D5C946_9LILI|nr:hypothetical protein J5N97_021828 [Dioscorea zingiberensis]
MIAKLYPLFNDELSKRKVIFGLHLWVIAGIGVGASKRSTTVPVPSRKPIIPSISKEIQEIHVDPLIQKPLAQVLSHSQNHSDPLTERQAERGGFRVHSVKKKKKGRGKSDGYVLDFIILLISGEVVVLLVAHWLRKGLKYFSMKDKIFPTASEEYFSQSQQDIVGVSSLKNIKFFSYNELRSATDGFHPRNKLGRGGFGTVYKGTLRNGTIIAAKVLSTESKQGLKEFLTEIDTIANVKHPNLVELLGYCVQENDRILVYEYAENNSLDHTLLGRSSRTADLNWGVRSAICIGAARGLMFLHEELDPPIVHRDIKASNILLDRNFVPKIGDFGLAKLFPDNITHISTRVAGTTGYLAPEYAIHGQLTKKADIYSFGVLILEIVSGRSISRARWSEMEKFLLERTWQLFEEGKLKELVDPNLEEYPEEEVLRYIKVALFCVQAAANRRPSVTQVVDMLSKPICLNEAILTPPGFIQDLVYGNKGSNAMISSNFHIKRISSIGSTVPFNSATVSCSELHPR